MVNRQQALKPTMVIDLDGTYVMGNTLHIYLTCAVRYHLHQRNLLRVAGITWYLLLRQMRLISHVRMKFRALSLAGRDEELMDQFRTTVRTLIHPKVESLRRDYSGRGGYTLLATAAADFYVSQIWPGDFVATRMDNNPERIECRGHEKVRRVDTWLHAHNARFDVVITDHTDDLPLLRANRSGKNYWVKEEEIILAHDLN